MTSRVWQFSKVSGFAVLLLAMLMAATSASAQWVMVAKAVSGRVQQMNHKPALTATQKAQANPTENRSISNTPRRAK